MALEELASTAKKLGRIIILSCKARCGVFDQFDHIALIRVSGISLTYWEL